MTAAMSINRTHNTRRWRTNGDGFLVRETFLKNGKETSAFMMVRNGWALRHTPKQGAPGHYQPDEDGGLTWVDGE
jgi:hypothetical protein